MSDHLKEAWKKMSEMDHENVRSLHGPHGPDGMDDDTYRKNKASRRVAVKNAIKSITPEDKQIFDSKIEELRNAKNAMQSAKLQLNKATSELIQLMKKYDPNFWHEDVNNIIDKLK